MGDSGHPFVDQHRATCKDIANHLISKAGKLLTEGKTDDELFFFLLYSLDMINEDPKYTKDAGDGKYATVICAEVLLQITKNKPQ